MSSDAVSMKNVGKAYRVFSRPIDRLLQFFFPSSEGRFFNEFWALKNISLEIKRGETIAIIGSNGSGKSTLLQVITGILAPTVGNVIVNGRVAALLELGSGFNPEFTGRENIYLNASIYGLTPTEINQRLEDILKFADIGLHVDQPVKTYSSGMFVRLAFAIIAHVDAEILIIDEALAVGDAVFTQRCMRFIREFKKRGTLIFVSHDLSSVLNLCDRSLWLDSGQLRLIGTSKKVVEEYVRYTSELAYGNGVNLEAMVETASPEPESPLLENDESQIVVKPNLEGSSGWKTGAGEIFKVEFVPASGSKSISQNQMARLLIMANLGNGITRPALGFLFRDRLGQNLFGENTFVSGPFTGHSGDVICAELVFKFPALPDGEYSMVLALADGDMGSHVLHHWINDALLIEVRSSGVKHGLFGVEFESVVLKKI
jgi:lipopolysaccharide transport system ATP-binding protein